jgi:hypothetical protein
MNIAIVNYSSPNGWYINGQKRIVETMKQFGYNGSIYMFQDNNLIGSPTHINNPYAFKVYAIQYARNAGHDVIWWMDSSIYAVKDISPILKIVEEDGYFFEQCGFTAGQWTNDRTLNYFGITRDESMVMPLFSAGFMILDFRHEIVREFFARWKNSCDAGMFIGQWDNKNKLESIDERCLGHRHDMSSASIIANQLKMKLHTCGTYLSYVGSGYAEPKESSIFHLQPTF